MPLHDFRSVFMPYCLKQQEDGSYAVLNREYKPVGFRTRDMIAYGAFPVLVRFRKALSAKQAQKLSFKGDPNTKRIYLYNDGTIPTESPANMRAYLDRIALLMRLKFKGDVPGSRSTVVGQPASAA